MFNHTNWFSCVFKTLPRCNSCAAKPADHHHDGTQGGAMENKASPHTDIHLLRQTDCSNCKKRPPSCCEVSSYMGLPLPYNVLSYTAHYQLYEDNFVPIFWMGAPKSHLITVGVISAQKNTLRLPTACEENIPTMENATENLSLTLSLIPDRTRVFIKSKNEVKFPRKKTSKEVYITLLSPQEFG